MLCGMYSPQTWGWAGHEELQLSVFSLGPDSVKGGRHVQCDRIWEGRGKGKGGGGGRVRGRGRGREEEGGS